MELEKIWNDVADQGIFSLDIETPKEEEYPPLPDKAYRYDLTAQQIDQEKKRRKKNLEKFLKDIGGTIEYWRRRLRSVYRPIPIKYSLITPGLKRWEQSCLEEDDSVDQYGYYRYPVRKAERRMWKQVDPSLKYYMKIPFFLIGIDHPLKAQQGLTPQEEKQWLTVRRTVGFICDAKDYDYYNPCYIDHPVKRTAEQYFYWLKDTYYKSPVLIDPRWRPVFCQYPSYMERRHLGPDTRFIWNKSCQTWQLGTINDQERVIFIGRLDDQVVSSFRQAQIVVPLELSTRLEWNNLLQEITADLPKAIEISQRYHNLIDDSYQFDFTSLTVDQVLALKDQAPDPANDHQISRDNFQADQPINLVRRLAQDLGSTIITQWIFTDQVKRCYLYSCCSLQLGRPIFLSHAKNLIRNCCFGCGKQFEEYSDSQRISEPIGYNLYYQSYGCHSRFDYESKIFAFPPDQEEIGEFCDDCIEIKLVEGKAV